jgi:Domain of unknown function DUF29
MATKPAELYDQDFYAWTQEQAAALRAQFWSDNRLDAEHLAEEIEDLGKSDLYAVESFIEQIIAHLLKLDYPVQDDPRAHWRAEILNFRRNAERRISPTIRCKVEADLEERYARARARSRRGHRARAGFDPRPAQDLSLRLGCGLAPGRDGRGRL